METAFFGGRPGCPLPAGTAWLHTPGELSQRRWEVLALDEEGCRALFREPEVICACGTVLLPEEWTELTALQIRAERVIACGLSSRSSLTLSSMGEREAVLCIQRQLLRPDGGTVEPQELPLPRMGEPPENALPLLGLGLLL